MEAGFPDSLLLHENNDNENVLDMAISLHVQSKGDQSSDQFRELISYFLDERKEVFVENNPNKDKIKKYKHFLRLREAEFSNFDLSQ